MATKDFCSDLKISNVPNENKQKIDTIAKNIGVTSSDFMKMHINRIIETTETRLLIKKD